LNEKKDQVSHVEQYQCALILLVIQAAAGMKGVKDDMAKPMKK
jgi:hypothetical protein